MSKLKFKVVPGSVIAPQGFLASGVFCDIKRLGTGKGSNKGQKRDLALIVSEVPAIVAGMFTTNQICAAPVKVCAERVQAGTAQAIVVNSGNANACTGKQGMKDARAMTALVAKQLHIPDEHILVGSTGRIVAASIFAYFIGEFCNSFVIARLKVVTAGKHLWMRTISSTMAGELVDTLVFYPLAFYGTWDTDMLLAVMMANYCIKVGWEIVATPLTYRIVAWLKRAERCDHYDRDTNFTPFSLET